MHVIYEFNRYRLFAVYLRISLPIIRPLFVTKFRVAAHKLLNEQGRHCGIERSEKDRIYNNCDIECIQIYIK